MVGVTLAEGHDAGCCCYVLLGDVFRGWRAGEDVELVLRDVVESGDGEVEVFGEDGFLGGLSVRVVGLLIWGGKPTGLWLKTSDARKVLSSENEPSSKTRRNSTPASRAWME
jgi:hypothetical protein